MKAELTFENGATVVTVNPDDLEGQRATKDLVIVYGEQKAWYEKTATEGMKVVL
jgi:hypothetical protein